MNREWTRTTNLDWVSFTSPKQKVKSVLDFEISCRYLHFLVRQETILPLRSVTFWESQGAFKAIVNQGYPDPWEVTVDSTGITATKEISCEVAVVDGVTHFRFPSPHMISEITKGSDGLRVYPRDLDRIQLQAAANKHLFLYYGDGEYGYNGPMENLVKYTRLTSDEVVAARNMFRDLLDARGIPYFVENGNYYPL